MKYKKNTELQQKILSTHTKNQYNSITVINVKQINCSVKSIDPTFADFGHIPTRGKNKHNSLLEPDY